MNVRAFPASEQDRREARPATSTFGIADADARSSARGPPLACATARLRRGLGQHRTVVEPRPSRGDLNERSRLVVIGAVSADATSRPLQPI
jgi:hypothetical protein